MLANAGRLHEKKKYAEKRKQARVDLDPKGTEPSRARDLGAAKAAPKRPARQATFSGSRLHAQTSASRQGSTRLGSTRLSQQPGQPAGRASQATGAEPSSQEVVQERTAFDSDDKYRMQVIKQIIKNRQKRMASIARILEGGKQSVPTAGSQEAANMIRQEAGASSGGKGGAATIVRKGTFRPPKSNFDYFTRRHAEQDFQTLQKKFLKYLKENNMYDESIESSRCVGYNKFDREIDPETEQLLAKMYRPRDELKKLGLPILGEEKVLEKLKRRRSEDGLAEVSGDLHELEIDSLIESAFCSEDNVDWEKYRLEIDQPPVSEVSQE